jgi:SNF family Na+-dependent transporter
MIHMTFFFSLFVAWVSDYPLSVNAYNSQSEQCNFTVHKFYIRAVMCKNTIYYVVYKLKDNISL